MSDYGIALGDPGGGPPVDLPTLGLPPPPPARIRITPEAKPKPVAEAKETPRIINKPIVPDDYPDYTPELSRKLAPQPLGVEPPKPINPADYPDWTPEASQPKPMPEIGGGEAAAMGVRSALTAGSYPWLKGMGAAAAQQPQSFSQYFSMPEYSEAGLTPEQAAQSVPTLQAREKALAPAYRASEAVRQPQYEYEQAAKKQNPWTYFGGELAGGAILGGAGLGRAITARGLGVMGDEVIADTLNTALQAKVGQGAGAALGRIGKAATGGAAYGATSGLGETLSSGETDKLGRNVALGTGVGAATGGLLRTIGEGPQVGSLLHRGSAMDRVVNAKIADTFANAGPIQSADVARLRAANPSATPAQIHQQASEDWIARGERGPQGPITPEMRQAAAGSGRPLTNLDLGGEATGRLARAASNITPEAKNVLKSNLDEAFDEQTPRMEGVIHNMTGGRLDTDALHKRAAAANEAAYPVAYAAGNRPIFNNVLNTVISSPEGQRAVPEALRAVGNAAGARGEVADLGTMQTATGHTIPRNPNIEFWDQFHRALGRSFDNATSREERRNITAMHENLLKSLDTEVPAFGAARGGAQQFLGEENAYKAGKKFVDSKDANEGRKVILGYQNSNNPANRELFARGFAEEMADRIHRVGDGENVITKLNKIIMTPQARDNMEVAMGQTRAAQLEALFRVEALRMTKRGVLGNSTTVEQAHALGHGPQSLGVVAAVMEAAHSLPPGAAAGALILYSLFKKYAANANQKSMAEVSRLLVSNDPRQVALGVQKVARDPALMQGLRVLSTAATVGAAREPQKAGAAAYALSQESPAVLEYFRGKEEHHPQQQEMVPAEEAR